jgi:NADH-quinone oxidoreductase subunit A
MQGYAASVIPMLVYGVAVLAVAAGMVVISHLLGQRHRDRATGEPFESGILPTGDAHLRFSAQFYIIAMFFVIFDLESVFIVAWAIAFRKAGWAGYAGVSAFITALLAVLVYEWRTGALDFAARGKKILKARERFISRETGQDA